MADPVPPAAPTRPLWLRLWPAYLIIAGLGAAWAFGLFDYLTFDSLRENNEALRTFVSEHFVLAIFAYILIYAAVTLFMLPGAGLVTITGGFLFGLAGGTPATVIGATLGASLLFLAAKSSIGEALRAKAGPFLKKMEAGFQEDSFSYLFALRFMPAIPFAISNIAPALLGAKFRDYVITTAIGIIPGVLAYTWIGAGLGATFAAGQDPDLASVAGNLIPAGIALAAVSLMPMIYKKFFSKKNKQAG